MPDSDPRLVEAARDHARRLGFTLSSEPFVGRMLAFFAAATPRGGRVIELGTGAGVGLAWIASALAGRDDVDVFSVEADRDLLASTQALPWPSFVQLLEGDGEREVARLGPFDLIFADAPGGKLTGLDATISALGPGGVLLVDDMDLELHNDDGLRDAIATVRTAILAHPELVALEVPVSSGVIVAARRGETS